jgi:hypothetical protein
VFTLHLRIMTIEEEKHVGNMTQINLYNFIKRLNIWFVAFVVLLVFMLFRGCESPAPKLVYKEVKVKNDSIDKEVISKYRDTIAFLDSQNQKKSIELQRLYKNKNNALKRINPKVVLKDKDSLEIALRLVDCDYVDSMYVVTTEMLGNEKTAGIFKDSIIGQFEVKENNLIELAKEQERYIKKQQRISKSLKYAVPFAVVFGLVVGSAL